jgi:PAS domain-containing protein
MSQGLCIFDPDDRVAVCNRRYLDMYGLTSEQAKPRTPLLQLLRHRLAQGTYPKGPEPEEYVRGLTASLKRLSAWTKVTELNDGRLIAVENRSIPGGGWVAMHEDVTALKRREQDLRTQNLRFDMAINNMSQGLSMFDAEQRLVVCNDRYISIYSVPPELRRPGTPMAKILEQRIADAVYSGDIGEARVLKMVSSGRTAVPAARVVELAGGRSILVKRQAMRTSRNSAKRRRALRIWRTTTPSPIFPTDCCCASGLMML